MKLWKRSDLPIILFVIYCVFIIWYTILSRESGDQRTVKFELFWAYKLMLRGVWYWKTEVIQNIGNVLFFIPYGFLFPSKHKNWKAVLIFTTLFSLSIELCQYVWALGWCEIDDVICNVLGAVIGFGVWKWIKGKFNAVGEKTRFL